MCNILICLDKQPTPEMLDALMVALAQGGFEGIASTPSEALTLITMAQPAEVAPAVEPEVQPSGIEATLTTAPEVAVPPEQVAAAVADIEAAFAAPAPQPMDLPNAIIKSLSLSTQVKTSFDPSKDISVLKVGVISSMINVNEITFTFGGMEYKYPAENDLIKVVVAFVTNDEAQYPCTLKVEHLAEGELEQIVFGLNDQKFALGE